jgi:hypothetical protein
MDRIFGIGKMNPENLVHPVDDQRMLRSRIGR